MLQVTPCFDGFGPEHVERVSKYSYGYLYLPIVLRQPSTLEV